MALALFQNIITIINQIFYIFLGILGVGFCIGFHEFGHFLFAKLFNISTPSFSIGMGPRILKKKIGETEFALSAIPLGGYVEIAGMAEVAQGEQKEAKRSDDHSFASKPYWQKLCVLFGGILFNLFFGYFALSMLFFIGMPQSPLVPPKHSTTIVNDIEPGSPAERFGIERGDTIKAIDNQIVENRPDLLIEYVKPRAGEKAQLILERSGERKELTVEIGTRSIKDQAFGFLGLDFVIPRYGLIGSIKHGFEFTNWMIAQVYKALKNIFVQRNMENVGGPLMVIAQTIKGAEKGFKIFLLLLAFISVNLAVLNIIPLPIMDGGQILFYTIEAIIRRPLSERIREYIHYSTWVALLILVVYLSVKDIIRMFFTHN